MYVHVDGLPVFDNLKSAGVFVQDAAVPKMTMCVTFGAPRFGPKCGYICTRSEYVTFSTISATAAREMTVCVTFGALHFGFPVATLRHPAVDHIGSVSHGSGFGDLRHNLFIGRRFAAH